MLQKGDLVNIGNKSNMYVYIIFTDLTIGNVYCELFTNRLSFVKWKKQYFTFEGAIYQTTHDI